MISFSEKIYVLSATEGTYKLGEYVKEDARRIEMLACVQPFFSNEHFKEASGRRVSSGIKIYTREELSSSAQANIVEWRGKKYEVYQVDCHRYTNFNLGHYKSIALQVDGEA